MKYEMEHIEDSSTISEDNTTIHFISDESEANIPEITDKTDFIEQTNLDDHDIVVFQAELLSGSSTIDEVDLVKENNSGHVHACAESPEDGTGNVIYDIYLFRIPVRKITDVYYTYRRDDGEILSTQ